MRWLIVLLLTAYTFEAPQIWTLDGASLSDSRLQLEQRLGSPLQDRPLKRSFAGETWEYTYGNGLKADFRDRDRGRHVMCLVGRRFFSRGRLLCQTGMDRARFIEVMGAPPLAQDDDQVVYFDDGRHAYLTGYFQKGKASEFVLSRFRVDQ